MIDNAFVAGATGRQGGAVVDHLLDAGVAVRGLTRDAASDAARDLADRGVRVVEGDLSGVTAADLGGVDAVFGLTVAHEPNEAYEQGVGLVEAALDAGVDHYVFSSGGRADDRPGIGHVDAKFAVEEVVRTVPLRATVVRPHCYMGNVDSARDALADGRMPFPIDEGVPYSMIAVDDIGRFVGRVLGDPRRFAGETIELAGDTCTLSEMADVLSGELGRPIEPVHHPADEIEDPAVRTFMQWVNDGGLHADPGALERDYGFAPTTFRDYVAARDWDETAAV